MKFKVDRGLLPVKVHFFFFFAALGPILPQLNVFGKQLGVSATVMGMVTAVLPLLWAAAKPLFGYVVDFWPNHRKLVFMMLILTMTGSYCGLWFLPIPDEAIAKHIYHLNETVYLKNYVNTFDKNLLDKYNCYWSCAEEKNFELYLSNSSYINTVYIDEAVNNNTCSFLNMDFDEFREDETRCIPKNKCDMICYQDNSNDTVSNKTKRDVGNSSNITANDIFDDSKSNEKKMNTNMLKEDSAETITNEDSNLYVSVSFWCFVVLMCIGTVAFNVANCIGDAVCFDVLGPERGSKYGTQRSWGTVGYGVTALLGGWLIDWRSRGLSYKDFTPAFLIAIGATAIDLCSCKSLKLPSMSSPDDSGKALCNVLKIPRVVVFIIFAVVAGVFDSFIIYYMFWFLEEIAENTNNMVQIKTIEGLVVAGQSFLGELVFFYFSGPIITRIGYQNTMTLSLFCYGVRMALISFIQHPWHLIYIESVMQGPTYALCYSCIVGYAAHVAPVGYSATVQGLVAGMDDGLGFAIGSLLGGVMYSRAGGRGSFRILALVAVIASVTHLLLCWAVRRHDKKSPVDVEPEENEKMLYVAADPNAVYRDTVVPLTTEINKTGQI